MKVLLLAVCLGVGYGIGVLLGFSDKGSNAVGWIIGVALFAVTLGVQDDLRRWWRDRQP